MVMENSTSIYSKFNKRLWYAAFGLAGFSILFFVIVSFQGLPDFKQLENPDFELASQVIDIKTAKSEGIILKTGFRSLTMNSILTWWMH